MRVQAIGLNSTVELYDHHLVIKRHPGFLEASATELLVPLTNIVSVQFRRPALFTSGRLIIALQGAAQPKRTSYERRTDQTAIAFAKGQLAQFEEVLRVIRMAIATPSIEQLAMAAAQCHAVNDRVGQAPREPTRGQLQRIDIQSPEQSHFIDAEFREPGAGSGYGRAPRPEEAPRTSDSGNFRNALGRAGTFVLIGVIVLLLLTMLTSQGENLGTGTAPADPAIDEGQTADATAQDHAATSADEMLSQWAEFVSGQAGTEGFGLTNGDGNVGQFCSASNGSWTMAFGGRQIGSLPLYDYFAALKAGTGFAGAFTFDPGTRQLTGVRLIKQKQPDGPSRSTPDLHMTVTQVQPGVVEIDGTQMHLCVL